MRRKDFEGHTIWAACITVKEHCERLSPMAGVEENSELNRISFLSDHFSSYRTGAAITASYFNHEMLVAVEQHLATAISQLGSHPGGNGYSSYTTAAKTYMEAALIGTSPWPRTYAKGAQAQQMKTLFDDLIETQERHAALMDDKFKQMEEKYAAVEDEVERQKLHAEKHFQSLIDSASVIHGDIEGEKIKMTGMLSSGVAAIEDLRSKDAVSFKSWMENREAEWADTRKVFHDRLATAEDEAAGSISRIKVQEKEFANISSAAAAGKLAGEFETEATSSRNWGLGLYGAGALLLILSTVPLLWILLDQTGSPDKQWQQLAARLSIGIIIVSGATVLIRLGARFINGATASKRMALELRTMGPFLANVQDKEAVDSARLELIDRAFGKSYVDSDKPDTEDAVPVSAISHLIELVKAANK